VRVSPIDARLFYECYLTIITVSPLPALTAITEGARSRSAFDHRIRAKVPALNIDNYLFNDTMYHLIRIRWWLVTLSPPADTSENRVMQSYDVLVVGAGAAGVGIGCALQELTLTPNQWLIIDRTAVGSSFRHWPCEMRLITPSFPGNDFGVIDLNAVTPHTSPALSLAAEHPSGPDYARYLCSLAEHFELPIRTDVSVTAVEPADDGFIVRTTSEPLHARLVIWAAGEFQYPRTTGFCGAEQCLLASTVSSWNHIMGTDPIIIGGYESGMDAAIHLARRGMAVRVIDAGTPWDTIDTDPSRTLSPYTQERLRALPNGALTLIGETRVERVVTVAEGYYVFTNHHPVPLFSAMAPILATGFAGSLSSPAIAPLFARRDDGYVVLTTEDESTITPGLFVVGPNVRHDDLIFCFIYKFRQRFAVVARAIGQRLGLPTDGLDWYRERGMFLDDLSCCDTTCAC